MRLVGLEHGARLAAVEHHRPEAGLRDIGWECEATVAATVEVVPIAVAHCEQVLGVYAGEALAHRRCDTESATSSGRREQQQRKRKPRARAMSRLPVRVTLSPGGTAMRARPQPSTLK
jgi:hypothetical protein